MKTLVCNKLKARHTQKNDDRRKTHKKKLAQNQIPFLFAFISRRELRVSRRHIRICDRIVVGLDPRADDEEATAKEKRKLFARITVTSRRKNSSAGVS